VFCSPVTEAALRELTTAAGSLPEGVMTYLTTSDGLKHPDLFRIYGAHDMLRPYPSSSLLPLREDGCGNYASVLIEPGAGFGAVVFWDHETTRAEYLLASSVPSYLELLLLDVSAYARWSPDGRSQNEFVCAHDADAARLLEDPSFTAMVGERGREFTVEQPTPPPPGEPWPPGAREGVNHFTKEGVVFMPSPRYRTPPTKR
jgi:hypothetical protein